MDPDRLRRCLDDANEGDAWFSEVGFADREVAQANLGRLAASGMTLDLLANICQQIANSSSNIADPDRALNNLERFVSVARNPLALAALFERDPTALPNLLQIFSTSQYLSDLLVTDGDAFDLLRMTEGRPVARDVLVDELIDLVEAAKQREAVLATLRRTKRRETLRIAYGDIVRNQSVAVVSRQISFLADAIVDAALHYARRELEQSLGTPRTSRGDRARFVVMALGKLGGTELNYSSDIDLILLYDGAGETDSARPLQNQEFFDRLGREIVRLLTEPTELGIAYRVDLRLRPEGSRGPICCSLESALTYYDVKGRTWERQAYVKARPIAGDRDLGVHFLKKLDPWIYRRYLSLADITGIKALKRRIEHRGVGSNATPQNVKTGHGGIRDIEFVIQFLQLVNGGAIPALRTGNTLEAIAVLAEAGCLTHQERTILDDNYNMLRKLEHRLQILMDLQTHTLPSDEAELSKLALRMGYVSTPHVPALRAFRSDLGQRTELNRKILDHLMHDAFGDDAATEPEVDLVNDPDPSPERIEEVMSAYSFANPSAAYDNLMGLATERIRFLSTRRCRHFLASIAPRLLAAIAATPDPDATLVSLSTVSDSLGGKSALWELFSANPPTLKLYVTLCAACPYLADILTSHPGMIDELMDSLLMSNLPSLESLEKTLSDLSKGAEDVEPILHSFKNVQHLRVGVRDILGKDDIQSTHAALADVAEACLKGIARLERDKLEEKFGEPTIGEIADDVDPSMQWIADRVGERCEFVVLAMGKLGGREPNYHSDLDLVFLFEAEGNTVHQRRSRQSTTSNGHFFSELGQRIMKVANHMGPHGRLYEVDPRLRPTGRSGPLAVTISSFSRYFSEGRAQLWERQALCKARVIYGAAAAAERTTSAVHEAAFGPPWQEQDAEEIRNMRARLEETASQHNLKRGQGGTVDTEFLVQMLQLRHGGRDPSVRCPGTLDALTALESGGYLRSEDANYFRQSYRFQRSVEARVRLMNSAGRHEFPTEGVELEKLAFLLGYSDSGQLVAEAEHYFQENRLHFDRLSMG